MGKGANCIHLNVSSQKEKGQMRAGRESFIDRHLGPPAIKEHIARSRKIQNPKESSRT